MKQIFIFLLIPIFSNITAQNLITNPDFSENGGSFANWFVTESTILEKNGDGHVAYMSGENGVLYQKVTGLEIGKTYEYSIHFKNAVFKQNTGYGFAFEKGNPLVIPEFTKGATDLKNFCQNNNGSWTLLDADINNELVKKSQILITEGTSAIYICIGTKGALAKMRVKSVMLELLQDTEITFKVKKKKDATPVENAEIVFKGISGSFFTDDTGTVKIGLPSSLNPYSFSVVKDWFKKYNGEISLGSDPLNVEIELEDIEEVKKVETRISKYGDNLTPYPIYGHFWTGGLNYNSQNIETITNALDYIVGGAGTPRDSNIVNQMHQYDPKFQVIRYSGGWIENRSYCEKQKMDLTYYRCGSLAEDVSSTGDVIVINPPPNSKGRGLLASEEGNFDIWIRIENELMKVISVSSPNIYPITAKVERGFDGTMTKEHSAGKTVTLPLYGTPPVAGQNGANISYFVTCFGARKEKIINTLFDVTGNYNEDGIWIDILNGRLSAISMFDNNYDEWDHNTEDLLSAANDISYTKSAVAEYYEKFYSRLGYYPQIYGNNVLFSQNFGTGSRGYMMFETTHHPKVSDGYCHENSWGHMSSDNSGIDHEGQVKVTDKDVITYGSDGKYLQWFINENWVDHCKAIALLAQRQLPNQPMTINAGYKNQWFAENLTDEIRYNFNKYAYASYLMCVDVATDSLISCRMGISPMVKKGSNISVEIQPYFYYPLGLPNETHHFNSFTNYRYKLANLYSRKFTNGLVLINPFGKDMTESISLAEISGPNNIYIDPENENEIVKEIKLNSRETKILLLKDTQTRSSNFREETERIKIYPSPVKNILHVEYNSMKNNAESRIEIYNLNGVLLLQKEISDFSTKTSVDVTVLRPGIYFLKIDGINEISKFLKSN